MTQLKYFRLAADYTQFPVRNEFEDFDVYEKELLPQVLVVKIENWNDKYKKLFPLNYNSTVLKEAAVLDQEGKLLAEELEKHFAGDAKVKYLSAL